MRMILTLTGVFAMLLLMGIENARGITLNDVYMLVLRESEEIEIVRQDILHAKKEKWRAISEVLPQITLRGAYDRLSTEEVTTEERGTFLLQPRDSYGAEVTLEQPLFAGGKHWAGIRMARREIKIVRKSLSLSMEAALLYVAKVFYGVLNAQKDVEAQERNVERLLEHRRLSELRFKVGEVTETILLRAEAELAAAHAELLVRENEEAVKKRELQILTGLPDGFKMEGPTLPEIPEGEGKELLEMAIQKRDDMKQSRLREGVSKEGITIARANFFPSITVQGTYFYRDQDPQSTFFIDESWFVGGRIAFPIFEGGRRVAEIAQARYRLKKDELENLCHI